MTRVLASFGLTTPVSLTRVLVTGETGLLRARLRFWKFARMRTILSFGIGNRFVRWPMRG